MFLEKTLFNFQTPSGQIVDSSKYSNGYFSLLLPVSEIEEGSYTCQVSSQDNNTCLHGHADVKAQVEVDSITAK